MCAAYVLEDLLGLGFAMLALFLDDENVMMVVAVYVVSCTSHFTGWSGEMKGYWLTSFN
jgi:hypothetical protein